MDTPADVPNSGEFDARYLAFLETIAQLRPRLHRYCARMSGSVMDGEDIVQDALFQAYRKLETFDETRPLAPWLFRIAHNQCIDFLRRRGVRQDAENLAIADDAVLPSDPPGPDLGRAVERLVLTLPPKERACVLLKDVFDYSLEEIAELVVSTVGGVKAALNRGRSKLAPQPEPAVARTPTAETSQLLHLYVERFNRRDWDGLRELISADARLLVADRFSGRLIDSPYFSRYELKSAWRMAVGTVDGEPVIISFDQGPTGWVPRAVVRLECADGTIIGLRDYTHCRWMIPAATSFDVSLLNADA
jgi:RNA polymerase sigma-70 factor (ECF subfamily)